MAQSSNKGKKGTAPKKKTTAPQKSDDRLNSVRGGSAQRGTRSPEAARGTGAKSGAKSAGTQKNPPKKPAAKSGTAAKKPAAPKKAPTQNTAPKKSTSKSGTKRMSAADARMWQRMMVIAVAVLAGVCFVIQLVSCAHNDISTRQAVMVTLSDNIETTGVAIRNERIVTSDRQGVIVGSIENGGKVSKGETVANVYTSTDSARAHMRMEEIEKDLEKFRSMSTAGEDSAVQVESLQKSIRSELLDLSKMVFRGDAAGAAEGSDELLYLLNKVQVATRVEEGFEGKVEELEKELDSLKKKYPDAPDQLKSPLSGYYISSPDGYESLLSTDICSSLTPEKLEEILSLRSEPDNSSVVGKIADDYIWYMACEVSADDAARLAKDAEGEYIWKNYTLYLAYSELDSISAKLVSVNTGADSGRRVLIFECSYMVSELATVRVQPVTIELSSYSGLEVSADSVTSREATVSASDIAQWDMEGREALAREICPEMFADSEPAVSAGDVSGSDAAADGPDEDSPEYKAAWMLLHNTDKSVSEMLKGVDHPKEVTFTQLGVYITWGSEIKFKRISPLYTTGNKVLCVCNQGSGCIKMYDNVVDDPEEVYDGQIINGMR